MCSTSRCQDARFCRYEDAVGFANPIARKLHFSAYLTLWCPTTIWCTPLCRIQLILTRRLSLYVYDLPPYCKTAVIMIVTSHRLRLWGGSIFSSVLFARSHAQYDLPTQVSFISFCRFEVMPKLKIMVFSLFIFIP